MDEVAPRRAYAAPRLAALGRISRITRSGGSANGDGGQTMMPAMN